jgi:hypothetical protein
VNLLKGQQLVSGEEPVFRVEYLLWHAVVATKIATVRDRYTEVMDDSIQPVF